MRRQLVKLKPCHGVFCVLLYHKKRVKFFPSSKMHLNLPTWAVYLFIKFLPIVSSIHVCLSILSSSVFPLSI